MSKLILPANARRTTPERVGCEIRGDDQGNVLLVFTRPIQSAVYTANEAAEIARALANAAMDQARHGGDPLKGLDS